MRSPCLFILDLHSQNSSQGKSTRLLSVTLHLLEGKQVALYLPDLRR